MTASKMDDKHLADPVQLLYLKINKKNNYNTAVHRPTVEQQAQRNFVSCLAGFNFKKGL